MINLKDKKQIKDRFSVLVRGMSEDAFKSKINKIFNRMAKIHEESRRAVISFLTAYQGATVNGSKIPRIDTGNLLRNIAIGGVIEKAPKFKSTNRGMKAYWTNYIGIDSDLDGSRRVLSEDGRNAPYAYYLNESDNFKDYNGYFKILDKTYRVELKTEISNQIDAEFKNAVYRL